MSANSPVKYPSQFPKSTGAVEISEPEGSLTLADRRLFNHLLAAAYRDLGKVDAHTVKMSEIRSFAAAARDGIEDTSNRRIKASITRLQQTMVQFNYLDSSRGEVWRSSQLLGECELVERTGELTYSFPKGLAERLIEPALYSYISLKVVYQFESKYALILYEILKRYADRNAEAPFWPVKTSELRDLFGCRDKLKDWKDFNVRAIQPAIEEINDLAEFRVRMSERREGRGRGGGKVVEVTFWIDRKDPAAAAAAARELDKARVQRRGERKIKVEEQEEARLVRLALAWMQGADIQTRMRWVKHAEAAGVALPKGATAPENLAKWVPVVAAAIAETENLR
ncbi:replication initiation protein [Azospirillum canadense]|uniref:replication initiation protein n=1 Tax=Azospirillum canadense TaxID=403962 RepID=UPI002225E45C|nr:replication initiation protein [Azospirillum canadense]MCW2242286.1 plasmid replication initiation protein [Azospirillum canadense]